MRLIDADALLSHVRKCDFSGLEKMAITLVVCRQPKIDAEPVKHGRWIRTSEHVSTTPVQHCSECGHNTNYDFPYCSNCGAKMDLKDGESE